MNPPKKRVAIPDLILAVGVLAFGGFFLLGAFNIRVLPTYARIGPRFFPYIVAVGLLVCGVFLCVQALRGKAAQGQQEENADPNAKTDWRALALLSVALVLHMLLIERVGFILASSLLFWGVAYSFGSRRYLRDGIIALLLCVVVYVVFTRLLRLNLPEGILGF
jgi:putative tricarboxylic transport membrane protein